MQRIKRKEKVGLRINEFEREAIEKLAELEQRTLSEMMRELLREGMKERGLLPLNKDDGR
jgi:hypothetical protein